MNGQHYNMNKNIKNKKGSVLIIVIVVSSILFTIGITFAFILEREILSQSYINRSQIALNIANSTLECVLYNDFQRNVFAPAFFGSSFIFSCGEFYQVRDKKKWGSERYFIKNIATETDNRLGKFEFRVIESENIDLNSVVSAPCAYVTMERSCSEALEHSKCQVTPTISLNIRGYYRCFDGHKENAEDQAVRKIEVSY